MTNSEQAIREIANKWGFRVVAENADDPDTEFETIDDSDQLFSDLTALISEHYVSREEYDEEKKSNSLLHKAMVTAEKGGHDKAMEEISKHYYPKEFTGWFRSDRFYDIFEESTDDIGITSWEYLPSGQVLYGLDEIHNYWKENER